MVVGGMDVAAPDLDNAASCRHESPNAMDLSPGESSWVADIDSSHETNACRVFRSLECLMRGTPFCGEDTVATVPRTIQEIATVGASSEQIASAVWMALKVARVLSTAEEEGGATRSSEPTSSAIGNVAAVVWGLTSDSKLLTGSDLIEMLDESEVALLMRERQNDQAALRVPLSEKRFRTRAFFSQTNFNLMREESEGFAKLVCLLGDTGRLRSNECNEAFIASVTAHVHALIGKFQLESNKIIEIVLAACCKRIESDPAARNTLCRGGFPLLYRSLLDIFSREKVAEMTCHVLAMYRALDRGDSESAPDDQKEMSIPKSPARHALSQKTPQSLLVLLATFVREDRLPLASVWPRLDPEHQYLVQLHEDFMTELDAICASKSNFNIGAGGHSMASQPQNEARSGSGSDRDIFARFPICERGPYGARDLQKIELLLIMLENARWTDVLEFMRLMSEDGKCVDVASHPPIAHALGKLIHLAIGPAVIHAKNLDDVDSESLQDVRNFAKHLDQLGGAEMGFVQSIPTQDVFFNDADVRAQVVMNLLVLLGPHVRRFPELFQDLCTLLDDDRYARCRVADTLVREVLMPGLFLSQSNPVIPECLWSVLCRWDYRARWSLYSKVREDVPLMYPVARLSANRASHEVKQVMKRLTVDNAMQFCSTVAKITHGQALSVFDSLLGIVCGYPADQSSIVPSVDVCSTVSSLAHDMLVFTLIDKLSNDLRSKLKEDGVNSSQWFANLSLYFATFLRKSRAADQVRPCLEPVMHFLFRQIVQKRDPMASILVSDILLCLAGIPIITIVSDKQIRAQSGGPALSNAACGSLANLGQDTSHSGATFDTRLDQEIVDACSELRHALLSCELSAQLPIGVAQLVCNVLHDENVSDEQLKLYSGLVDRVLQCQQQLASFFALPVSKSLRESFRKVGAAPLMRDYGLAASSVFLFLRPEIDFLDVFPGKSEFHNGNPGPGTHDATSVSSQLPADVNASQGVQVQVNSSQTFKHSIFELSQVLTSSVTEHISVELYVAFWILELGDLIVPLDLYKAESARLTAAMAASDRERNHYLETPDLENPDKLDERRKWQQAEVKRIHEAVQDLNQEMNAKSKRQQNIYQRLQQWRKSLLPACMQRSKTTIPNAKSVVSMFLGECVLPRCGMSGTDAIFCSRFPLVLMELGIDAFDISTYFSMLMLAIPARLLAATEGEALYVSSLLRETLETLDRWRLHSEQFDREAGNRFSCHFTTFDEDGSRRVMNHKEYCDWLFTIHDGLTNSFMYALMKTEYLMLRNSLEALSRILHVFPKVIDHAKVLGERIEDLHKSTSMEDVRMSALALHGRIGICRSKALPQHVFRLRPASKPGSSPSKPGESKRASSKQGNKKQNGPAEEQKSRPSPTVDSAKQGHGADAAGEHLKTRQSDSPMSRANDGEKLDSMLPTSGDTGIAKKRPRSPSDAPDDNPSAKARRQMTDEPQRHVSRQPAAIQTSSSQNPLNAPGRDDTDPMSRRHVVDGTSNSSMRPENLQDRDSDEQSSRAVALSSIRANSNSEMESSSQLERPSRFSRDTYPRERDQDRDRMRNVTQERAREIDRGRERMRNRGREQESDREFRDDTDRDRARIRDMNSDRDRYRDTTREWDREGSMRDRDRREPRYQKSDAGHKVERDRGVSTEREVLPVRDAPLDRGPRPDRQNISDRVQLRNDRTDHERSMGPGRHRFDRRERFGNVGFAHNAPAAASYGPGGASMPAGDKGSGNGFSAGSGDHSAGGSGRGGANSGRYRYRSHRR